MLISSSAGLATKHQVEAEGATARRNITYRLLPQKQWRWRWLEQTLEDQRQLYIAALQERQDCYRKTGRTITYFDQSKSLTECRSALPGMAKCPLYIQRGTLQRLDFAYRSFLQGKRGYPKFPGRDRWNSMALPEGVKVRDDTLVISGFGGIRIRRRGTNPHEDGRPTSAVLKREGGKWYAVVCYAVAEPERHDDGTIVGVDMNVGQVATSDRQIHYGPDTEMLEARKRRYQRMLSRRKKGSKRRERARQKLAKTARKIAMKRHDWQHRASRQIADSAHAVVVEDLKTRNMTASAKGSVEEPGRRVKQKAGLNRVILDTGWSALRRMLEYKAGRMVAINPAYTSQTCAACGVVDAASRRSQYEFRCTACGHMDNADLNAAANIRRQGLAQLRGEAAGTPGRRTANTCSAGKPGAVEKAS